MCSLESKFSYDLKGNKKSCNICENAKTEVCASVLSEPRDIGPKLRYDCDIHILPHESISCKEETPMRLTYVQHFRSKESDELQEKDPNLFLVLMWASRQAARYDTNSYFALDSGEVMMPRTESAKKCGLTEKEFRNAVERGIKKGYFEETFNPIWIKKGPALFTEKKVNRQKRAIERAITCMVIKVIKSGVCDVNEDPVGQPMGQPGASQGPAMGHNIRREEDKEEVIYKERPDFSDEVQEISKILWQAIQKTNPKVKEPKMSKWHQSIDKMLRIDKHTGQEIRQVISFVFEKSDFWYKVIQSADNLRDKFPKIWIQFKNPTEKKWTRNKSPIKSNAFSHSSLGKDTAELPFLPPNSFLNMLNESWNGRKNNPES